jgi:hypothetical protein
VTLDELNAELNRLRAANRPLIQQRDDLDRQVRENYAKQAEIEAEISNLKSHIKVGDLIEWEVGGRRRNVWLLGDNNRTPITKRRGRVMRVTGSGDSWVWLVKNIRADNTEGSTSKLSSYWGAKPVKVEEGK